MCAGMQIAPSCLDNVSYVGSSIYLALVANSKRIDASPFSVKGYIHHLPSLAVGFFGWINATFFSPMTVTSQSTCVPFVFTTVWIFQPAGTHMDAVVPGATETSALVASLSNLTSHFPVNVGAGASVVAAPFGARALGAKCSP